MTDKQPCPDHGGTGAKRRCPECHREKKRRYYQENRDEILERNRRYREKNREKVLEGQRRYGRENRDKIAEQNRRYYQENRDYRQSDNNRRHAAKNRASKYLATNSGKLWTPQEVAKMHRLRRQGLTNYEVAVELGRSLKSVIHRINQENARN